MERPNADGISVLPLHSKGPFRLQTDTEQGRRRFFPYSVIPGGAQSAEELKSAVARDPVVAMHYVGVDLTKAEIIRLDKNRSVYVSYRLGDRVFWTRRKLSLLKGETLITDGKHAARARCGNRISETPTGPVSAEEPRPEAFEPPQDPGLLSTAHQPFHLPLATFPPPDFRPVNPGDSIFTPPIVSVPLENGPSAPFNPVRPLPAPIPEPGTLLLLSTGLSVAWLLRKKWKD